MELNHPAAVFLFPVQLKTKKDEQEGENTTITNGIAKNRIDLAAIRTETNRKNHNLKKTQR